MSHNDKVRQRIRAIEGARDKILKARKEGRSICRVSKIGSVALVGKTRKKVAFLSVLLKNKKLKRGFIYFSPCALYGKPKWDKELRELAREF